MKEAIGRYLVTFSGEPSAKHLAVLAELWAEGLRKGGLDAESCIAQIAVGAMEAQDGRERP